MSFFVDANVIVYSRIDSDRREACAQILDAIAHGTVDGRTSTAALEEVWHLELSGKAGAISGLTKRAYTAFAPLLSVTDEVFERAMALDMSGLGANDRIHVATALAHGIDLIVSADAAFDGIPGIRRIDPLSARAEGLLGTET